MSSFPQSPRLLKGAIVGLDIFNPLASVIPFQYNPDTLTRSLTAGGSQGARGQNELLRLAAPPRETIELEIELDATDDLEKEGAVATSVGLHPTLASLELLLYPKSARIIANEVLAQVGVIEIVPPSAPLTFFIWGVQRVVPVRLTQLQITEEAFDTRLNPIRARVHLGLEVLTYHDLGLASIGGAAFMAHQVIKETMATVSGVGALTNAGSANLGASLKIG